MTGSSPRAQILGEITALMRREGLTIADIAAFQSGSPPVSAPETGGLLQKVMIYLGAVFVFVGICIYVSMVWDDLGSVSRILVTLGSGFIAFILGLMAIRDHRFEKAVTPLFLIAAGLEPTGIFIYMDEYLPHTGEAAKAASFVFALMVLQNGAAFAATARTSLLFFSLLFFVALQYSMVSWLDLDETSSVMMAGTSLLLVCWGLSRGPHASIAPFGFFWSSVMICTAAFDWLEDTPFDVALLGVSAALVYLSVHVASRTLLTVAVLSLLCFLGYFTNEYFKDVFGWPFALILAGFLMMGTSFYAVRLGRRIQQG